MVEMGGMGKKEKDEEKEKRKSRMWGKVMRVFKGENRA